MELVFSIPKSPEEEAQLTKTLAAHGIEEEEAESLMKILRVAGKKKRLRDSVTAHNERMEKGKLHQKMKRCAIKEHLRTLLEGIRPKYATCASLYATQMRHFSPNINEHAVFSAALNTVNGIGSQIRNRKSRLLAHKFTKSLLDRHPILTEKAIEYLHFSDRFTLVKQDYETIDNFMGLLDLSKADKAKK